MEKVLYVLIGIGVAIITYLFGKRNGNDNRANPDRVDDVINGAIKGLDEARQNTTGVVDAIGVVQGDLSQIDGGLKRSEDRLNESTDRLNNLTDTVEKSRKQNDTITERNNRITKLFSELQKRRSDGHKNGGSEE